MTKINLFIAGKAKVALDALAKSTGLTVSEHIRRAIDAYLKKEAKQ